MRRLFFSFVVAAIAMGMGVSPAWAAKAKPEKKETSPEQVFAKLDKDKDNKLSKAEIVGKKTGDKADKAEKKFAKLDKNSDGSVSLAEFKDAGKKKKK